MQPQPQETRPKIILAAIDLGKRIRTIEEHNRDLDFQIEVLQHSRAQGREMLELLLIEERKLKQIG